MMNIAVLNFVFDFKSIFYNINKFYGGFSIKTNIFNTKSHNLIEELK